MWMSYYDLLILGLKDPDALKLYNFDLDESDCLAELKRLSGLDYGKNIKKWENWVKKEQKRIFREELEKIKQNEAQEENRTE